MMADKNAQWSENADGPFYVDDQCIACDACILEAPQYFSMNEDDGHAYVFQQPRGSTEIKKCQEALENCPVQAIGSNG